MARKSQRGAGSGCTYRNKNTKSLKKSRKSQRGGNGCQRKPAGQNGGNGCQRKPPSQRGAGCGGSHRKNPPGQRGAGCGGKHNNNELQRGGAYGRGNGHGRHYKNTPRKLSRKRRTSLKRKSLVVCGPEGCNGQRK